MNHKLNKLNMKTTLTGKDRTAIPTEYVFGNAGDRAKTQFLELSRLYDAQTIRHIEQRGIDEGWSCLEVGGGGGSIASWLCVRVGATGDCLPSMSGPLWREAQTRPQSEGSPDGRDLQCRSGRQVSFDNIVTRRPTSRANGCRYDPPYFR